MNTIPLPATGPQPGLPMQQQPFVPLQLGLSQEARLALMDYWRSVLKRKWAILALGLTLALLAGVVAFSLTPQYRSTATVLIEQGRGKVLSIEDLYSGGMQTREYYQTQVEVMKSRAVAARTAKQLKLWDHPDFDPRLPDTTIRGRIKAMLGVEALETEWTEDKLANAVAEKLMEDMSIEPIRLSQLVKVSFESPDAQLAARVANAIAANYIDADRESRFSLSQGLNAWLESRATELKQRLAESEAALQTYREQNDLVNLSGSAQALAGQQARDVALQLTEARNRRLQLESAYQTVKSISDGDYSDVPAVVNSNAVQSALVRVAVAEERLTALQESLGAGNPKVQEAESTLAAARAVLKSQQRAAVQSLTQEYNQALRAEQSLASLFARASGSVQDVNRKEAQLASLERDVQSNRELFATFMTRAKEIDAGGDINSAVARVVDPAVLAKLPVSPKKGQIVLVALVLGLMLGAMGALLLDRLDNTIKGSESAELKLQQPVLSVLPKLEGTDNAAQAMAFLKEPNTHHAEAIRTARTGVLLSNVDEAHRVLMVTSSVPGEGKTTLCTNLGLALAQTKRTLLIDADMRRPQLGERLGLPAGAKGLSNLVTGTATLKECVHHVADSHLLVMPAGDLPPNPSDLLLSQRFRDMLKHLQSQLDFVIIDSPPVELVSDALSMAPLATSTIYVVKAMDTPYPMARKGIGRLERAGAKMLGLVVNGLDFEHAQRYYGEQVIGGYHAYYGTGTPYGTKPAA